MTFCISSIKMSFVCTDRRAAGAHSSNEQADSEWSATLEYLEDGGSRQAGSVPPLPEPLQPSGRQVMCCDRLAFRHLPCFHYATTPLLSLLCLRSFVTVNMLASAPDHMIGCCHMTGCHHMIACCHITGCSHKIGCGPVIACGHMIKFDHVVACDCMWSGPRAYVGSSCLDQRTKYGKCSDHQSSGILTNCSRVQPMLTNNDHQLPLQYCVFTTIRAT